MKQARTGVKVSRYFSSLYQKEAITSAGCGYYDYLVSNIDHDGWTGCKWYANYIMGTIILLPVSEKSWHECQPPALLFCCEHNTLWRHQGSSDNSAYLLHHSNPLDDGRIRAILSSSLHLLAWKAVRLCDDVDVTGSINHIGSSSGHNSSCNVLPLNCAVFYFAWWYAAIAQIAVAYREILYLAYMSSRDKLRNRSPVDGGMRRRT